MSHDEATQFCATRMSYTLSFPCFLALLINTARGPVVNEEALIEALGNKAHGPAAAALDVVSEEPLPASHPLVKLPNVVLTPHIGGYSDQMFVQFWRLSVESILAMARGELPESLVNPAAINGSDFASPARITGIGAAGTRL